MAKPPAAVSKTAAGACILGDLFSASFESGKFEQLFTVKQVTENIKEQT